MKLYLDLSPVAVSTKNNERRTWSTQVFCADMKLLYLTVWAWKVTDTHTEQNAHREQVGLFSMTKNKFLIKMLEEFQNETNFIKRYFATITELPGISVVFFVEIQSSGVTPGDISSTSVGTCTSVEKHLHSVF